MIYMKQFPWHTTIDRFMLLFFSTLALQDVGDNDEP